MTRRGCPLSGLPSTAAVGGGSGEADRGDFRKGVQVLKYIEEYRSPRLLRGMLQRLEDVPPDMTVMEVCGTHTMAISRYGLRPLLSPRVDLVSGPGCPVCVTAERDLGKAFALARMPDVILATFGDMMKVPGPGGTLVEVASRGGNIKVVYSPLEALSLAEREPRSKVVFLGVGFETTAPSVAGMLIMARRKGVRNIFVLSLHKTVPPALRALVNMEGFNVNGFILPGHVSAVIGSRAYSFIPEEYGIPCVIAGFEPADILQAVYRLAEMRKEGRPAVEIEYSRVVHPGGNARAVEVMNTVFGKDDAEWRGLGIIPGSGLALREEFKDFDAGRWDLELPEVVENKACRCGEVLTGRIRPPQCPLFAGACTPEHAVGPCMVSTEGTCASYYHYEQQG